MGCLEQLIMFNSLQLLHCIYDYVYLIILDHAIVVVILMRCNDSSLLSRIKAFEYHNNSFELLYGSSDKIYWCTPS